jgi:hypothetical protein
MTLQNTQSVRGNEAENFTEARAPCMRVLTTSTGLNTIAVTTPEIIPDKPLLHSISLFCENQTNFARNQTSNAHANAMDEPTFVKVHELKPGIKNVYCDLIVLEKSSLPPLRFTHTRTRVAQH